jgi:hypothetical protein
MRHVRFSTVTASQNYPVHGKHRHRDCCCERVTERLVCPFCLSGVDLVELLKRVQP